ncbi:MAG TPA: magnesium/cobalt transporter CorA [Phnomibacter sp.]|nr:magnesium/cobalt transporter CorA [Phnomibacter sp.]
MATNIGKKLTGLGYRNLLKAIARQKTRAVVKPFQPAQKHKVAKSHITVYDYNAETITEVHPERIEDCFHYIDTPTVTWINMDNLNPEKLAPLCERYQIHWLIQEDILTYGQRPKVEEMDGILFCLLRMLFIDKETGVISEEQISIVLGENFVLSFQEDAEKDVFDPIRKRLLKKDCRERQRGAEFLFYTLIDIITDSYLAVIETVGDHIEQVEENILQRTSKHSFDKISQLRKDIILLKRNIAPVRDITAALIRSESPLLDKSTSKYFRDVYDHVVQANDLIDNYRDLILGVQDMYVNNINLRMNEVMKTLAIITAIMAPATVIGGIFGMNFDVIPYKHHYMGFYVTIGVMVVIPIIMLYGFKVRGWFQKDITSLKNRRTDEL